MRLKDDWDKSHFRLGSVLEALGRQPEVWLALSYTPVSLKVLVKSKMFKALLLHL